jgi:rubredoxin
MATIRKTSKINTERKSLMLPKGDSTKDIQEGITPNTPFRVIRDESETPASQTSPVIGKSHEDRHADYF